MKRVLPALLLCALAAAAHAIRLTPIAHRLIPTLSLVRLTRISVAVKALAVWVNPVTNMFARWATLALLDGGPLRR